MHGKCKRTRHDLKALETLTLDLSNGVECLALFVRWPAVDVAQNVDAGRVFRFEPQVLLVAQHRPVHRRKIDHRDGQGAVHVENDAPQARFDDAGSLTGHLLGLWERGEDKGFSAIGYEQWHLSLLNYTHPHSTISITFFTILGLITSHSSIKSVLLFFNLNYKIIYYFNVIFLFTTLNLLSFFKKKFTTSR